MEYSQRTPGPLPLISALFSVGECLVEGDGREMSGAAQGSTLCCVWALEPLVTGHCQVGSAAGAGLWAHQECSRLISCKGALDPLKEKQMSL